MPTRTISLATRPSATSTATTAGEPVPVVMADGGGGEGEDGGGVVVASGMSSGRPSNTPRVRGVGKGRINEGKSLPGVKVDGLGGSPLALLPAAPAADLAGGGKIAGDPIFDVKEIGVALDQLAREILRHLKEHKLTVVWLFDESTSMQDDQRTIFQKFDRVSSELKVNVEPDKKIGRRAQPCDRRLRPGDRLRAREAPRRYRPDRQGHQALEDRPHRHREHHEGLREVVEHYAGLIQQGPPSPDRAGDRRIRGRRRRRRGGATGAQEIQGASLRHRPAVALRLSVRPPPLRRPGDQGRLPSR